MSQLLIEIDSPEDEALLLQLLSRLNVRVVPQKNESLIARKTAFMAAIDQLQKSNIAEIYGDAAEWQREIRSWDRVLDGREE
ncbi:hypothetical protein [Spirosoma sp. KUDC1026]|uniref:hypothetical protein n=1 Tax=Spirosoma sp. KUDC1026 TaxID=2745947 RepID=UPI00159BA1B8|nr:hypothetical protein [Spirosoma sp. KUDC1026]QKZ14292.1 hypothetical protein HU175_17320 [Spirosoma sp. KUDC1026]